MINNSINFTSGYKSNTVKEVKNDKNENLKQNTEEDNSFEATARKSQKEDAEFFRGLIAKSLIAMSLISSPFVINALAEDNDTQGIPAKLIITEDDQKLLDRAALLSKDGKDSTVLEAQEFYKLLNYSSLNDIPRLTRENIRVNATAGFTPVDMKSYNSDEEVLKQVRNAQRTIDYIARRYKENPPKSSQQIYAEYAINNITDREILDKVDFSELEIYQNDLTGVKNSINMTRERIRRDDIDAAKKEEKAVAEAQRFVDGIVNRYKTRAKVSGNVDGNDVLSKFELASLLNMESIKDLPEMLQFRIINKALEDYNPRSLSHVKSSDDAERENERVDSDRQKAQEKLDEWAFKAQREFFHILHPNEIAVWKHD